MFRLSVTAKELSAFKAKCFPIPRKLIINESDRKGTALPIQNIGNIIGNPIKNAEIKI